jgi:hypothetical protein
MTWKRSLTMPCKINNVEKDRVTVKIKRNLIEKEFLCSYR